MRLARLVFELETAAAEIEHAAFGHPPSNPFGQRVQMPPSVLLSLQETGLTQNTEMLRSVVLRDAGALRNVADIERAGNEQADDSDARVLGQRLQRDDAIVVGAGRRGRDGLTIRETVERERLRGRAGRGHLLIRIKIAQSGERRKRRDPTSTAFRNRR